MVTSPLSTLRHSDYRMSGCFGKMLVKVQGMTYGWRRKEGWGLPSERDGLQGHKCLSEVGETWGIQLEGNTRQGYRSCSEERGPDKTLWVTVATGESIDRDTSVTDWRHDKRHVIVVVVLAWVCFAVFRELIQGLVNSPSSHSSCFFIPLYLSCHTRVSTCIHLCYLALLILKLSKQIPPSSFAFFIIVIILLVGKPHLTRIVVD